jgi:hypothetical protein
VDIDYNAMKNGELHDAGEGIELAEESTCISTDDQNGPFIGVNGLS